MSRQGSVFYDAPEALGGLAINEEKDELGKMVALRHLFSHYLQLFSLLLSLIRNHRVVVMMRVMRVPWIVNYRFHHN